MDSKTFFERTGAILILICVVALLGVFGYSYYLAKSKAVQPVSVNITVQVDSTGTVTSESAQSIASLEAARLMAIPRVISAHCILGNQSHTA